MCSKEPLDRHIFVTPITKCYVIAQQQEWEKHMSDEDHPASAREQQQNIATEIKDLFKISKIVSISSLTNRHCK